jgi:hypothetical protein
MATTTPNYGWDVPTSTDYVADGAVAIETLGDDIDATLYTALGGTYPGLRLIKKQTIGSAVSSVTVTGAFSSTYDNYQIMVAGGVASGSNYLMLSLGAVNTNYYSTLTSSIYNGGAFLSATTNNGIAYGQAGWVSTQFISLDVNLLNPFLTKRTLIKGSFAGVSVAGAMGGVQDSDTSFTAITITPQGGHTLTGGTIYVYVYGASS